MMFQEIAPHRLDIDYMKGKGIRDGKALVFLNGSVLLGENEEGIFLPRTEEVDRLFPGNNRGFLFLLDGEGVFAYYDCEIPPFGDYSYRNVTEIRNMKPMYTAWTVTMGNRLNIWYTSSRYCGRCGEKTVHSSHERAMTCPSCGNVIYPQICPSVIVAVRNGEKICLIKYAQAHSSFARYALVAGYVETGETPEDAVRREVMEEVGLRIKDPVYYKSQPWPVSGALLHGYFCDLDGDDTITVDTGELSEAVWMDRENVPIRENDISLTSEMMELFRTGRDSAFTVQH